MEDHYVMKIIYEINIAILNKYDMSEVEIIESNLAQFKLHWECMILMLNINHKFKDKDFELFKTMIEVLIKNKYELFSKKL